MIAPVLLVLLIVVVLFAPVRHPVRVPPTTLVTHRRLRSAAPSWVRSGFSRWAGRLAVAAGAGVVGAVVLGPAAGVVAVVLGAAGPEVWAWWLRARHLDAAAGQVPLAADLIGRRLRAGDTVAGALRAAAAEVADPLGPALADVVDRFERGEPLPEALGSLARRLPIPSVEVMAAVLGMVRRLGGPAPQALADVAASARDRLQGERSARAAAAQARVSAAVVAVLPLVFGLLVGAVDARALALLWSWPLGVACLGGGLVLDLAGFWWMARLARSVS